MSGRVRSLMVAVVVMGLAPLWAKAGADAEPSVQDYSVLWERNIFSRERGHRPPATAAVEQERREVYRPERDHVLTGIVHRGAEWLAFLEDLRTGETIWAGKGEEIAGGTIKSITLDGIEFEVNGEVTTVKPGDDLAGRAPAEAADYGSLPGAGSSAGGRPEGTQGDGGPGGGDAADILEQLKRRREEELK